MVREDFLQQSAFDEIDAFCPLEKQYWMMKVIHRFHRRALAMAVGEVSAEDVMGLAVVAEIARMRDWPPEEAARRAEGLLERIDEEVTAS